MSTLLRFLKHPFAALAHPRAPMIAGLFMPLLFGLLALRRGQDINWDLQNYHWYNPYALLNGRLAIDMAPGGWQSYFNPTIDLPYYLMMGALPAPLVGFIMGCVHGLNFVLIYALARRLPGITSRLALLLAAAGVCSAGFLSQLGNTMGDNLTSLLVLASLYLLLKAWDRLRGGERGAWLSLLGAGLLLGLGAGLKLTNATYAVAVCAAVLTIPAPLTRRIANAFLYGCGVLAGLVTTAGYWWLTLWHAFGNPLFPQFNDIFKSPLAQQRGVLDDMHLPQTAMEAVFWPFIIMMDYKRVSEIAIRPAILPVLYSAAFVFAAVWLVERLARRGPARPAPAALSPQGRFLLVFGLLAYLAWIKLFSIYRYLVPLELLAPVMLWLLVQRLAAPRHAAQVGSWLLVATSLAVFPIVNWGHAHWSKAGISADFPALPNASSTIIVTAHGHPPMGWLSTFVPKEAQVLSLTGGFPESPAYLERIQAAFDRRPGPYYAMLAGTPKDNPDAAKADHELFQNAAQNLTRYGLVLDEAGCKDYPAAMGSQAFPFRLCPLTRKPAGS